ncbi:unnamed protein product [Dicrocoelium dendriticum]|nr:unnamed protein product [Dicrocoelium dendriticum]
MRGKQQDDLNQWNLICDRIGARVKPTNITRVTRHPNSAHYGEPRILRITLASTDDVEAVLLSAYHLRGERSKIRIFPDVPWSERQREKNNLDDRNTASWRKTTLVHDVPELLTARDEEAHAHDLEEWRYIRETLSAGDVILQSISRLPVSPHYKSNGPSILKLVVQSQQMAAKLMRNWHKMHNALPSELRFKLPFIESKPPEDVTSPVAQCDKINGAEDTASRLSTTETDAIEERSACAGTTLGGLQARAKCSSINCAKTIRCRPFIGRLKSNFV